MTIDKTMKKEWYQESTGEYSKYKGEGQYWILHGDVDFDGKDVLIISIIRKVIRDFFFV